ncbi:long-chain fatty acid--CoA ligase [Frankia sp. R82]|uniref:long-chain-fatty-acid--CoA ligase n=1 Tax=Frankia sp. R82 TaxID=2950553 RepID=UPI002042BDEE|nr:long-chain fatty acid--CoA ligase [Frankia sp. R82]MCM3886524.1 long-chain fatty acid--CoA ligase [Frankia sp. R82]
MLNLAVVLEEAARTWPERDALVFGERHLTYAELDAAARQVAAALAGRGIGPGDRVALSCPNLPAFPAVYFGILKAGATVVPLSILLAEREIAFHLADSAARAYLCFEGTAELLMGRAGHAAFASVPGCETFVLITADPTGNLSPAVLLDEATGRGRPGGGVETLAAFTAGAADDFDTVPTSESDIAVVLYTSGTTGSPKGAQLTHSNMVHNALVSTRVFDAAEHDVHLVVLPLFHAFGQTTNLNAGFASGATLVLVPRFEPQAALAALQRNAVTFFAGVPTMYWALLHCPDVAPADLDRIASCLRICVSGGSAMPAEVLRAFERRFGVAILEGYGLSETSPVATFNRADRPRRVGSIGLPVWGVEVRVTRADGTPAADDETGELCVRGHNVMRGYLGQPEATATAVDAQGWFHTGDLGRRDADGYFYLVDRLKDMIIRGGFNVYPREVEEVLLTHPDVSLAAVVGIPHERHGQEIMAFVIRRPGASLTADELVAWCRETMAAYKYPRHVEFRDALPMTAAGKILKRQLVADQPTPIVAPDAARTPDADADAATAR